MPVSKYDDEDSDPNPVNQRINDDLDNGMVSIRVSAFIDHV